MYGGVTSSYDRSSTSSYAPAPHRHRFLSFCVVVTLVAKKKKDSKPTALLFIA